MKPGNALVTGAARRIGRAIALALAAEGWSVALHFRASREEAADTAAECRRSGALRTAVLAADLTDPDARVHLVQRAASALEGPVSLLVNNASGFHRDDYTTPDGNAARANFEIDLAAPLALTQHFAAQAPVPDEEEGGMLRANAAILNLVDAAALRPVTGFASYQLAKSALVALTRNAAMELAPNVRVNAIAPGPTLPAARQSDAHFTRSCVDNPLRRATRVEDITATALFILGSPTMTGQVIALDGGLHLGVLPHRSGAQIMEELIAIEDGPDSGSGERGA